MERVDKLLCSTGRWSRKEARALVKEGRVCAEAEILRDPGEKLAPGTKLLVDGAAVLTEGFVYLMLNKPQGLISSTEDPREKTVLDLLPDCNQRQGLFPIGRLDKDTEGLLLLTNDGPLAHHLLSPQHHVEKVYYVEVEGLLEAEDTVAFAHGLRLRDGTLCRTAGLEIGAPADRALVHIQEGKYHQIKRMLAARGKPVRYLKRLSMGALQLDKTLAPGEFRSLKPEEVALLRL